MVLLKTLFTHFLSKCVFVEFRAVNLFMYPLSTLAFGSQFLNEFMNSLVSKSESITIPVCSVVKLVNKNFGSS